MQTQQKFKDFPSREHITAVISMVPVIHALKRPEMQVKGNIILPVYFGCYDHCKTAFCIGQVCRRYNDITSCRKPAKPADFLGIAVRNTAHQRLQVYKRSSLWFPAAVRHLQKRMQACLPFCLSQVSQCFIPRTPQCGMVHLYSKHSLCCTELERRGMEKLPENPDGNTKNRWIIPSLLVDNV